MKKEQIKHGLSGDRIYRIWQGMKSRCLNPTNHSYHRYGGRGIVIFKEWEDITKFNSWAKSSGYTDNLSIERIDNDGNYEPDNCCWIPRDEQYKNRSMYTTNKSGFTGVYFQEKCNNFMCNITINREIIYIGTYPTAELANNAREKFKSQRGL